MLTALRGSSAIDSSWHFSILASRPPIGGSPLLEAITGKGLSLKKTDLKRALNKR